METIEAAETLDLYFDQPDYSSELYTLIEKQELTNAQLEQANQYLAYLPEIYNFCGLILGLLIVIVVWRLLTSFLGRVFNDTNKL